MTVKIRPYKGSSSEWEIDIRFSVPSGLEIRRRIKYRGPGGKLAAREWGEARERKLYAEHSTPDASATSKRVPTVEVFAPRYLEHCERALRQKASTLNSKRCSLRKWIVPRMGKLRLDEISTPRVNALKADLAVVGWSAGNNVLRCLTNMLTVAIDDLGVLEAMPCRVKTFTRVRVEKGFHAPSTIEALCAVATPMERAALLLGSHAGLRCGEIIGLQWPDIEWALDRIYVQRSRVKGILGLPKANKPRHAVLTETLRAALKALPRPIQPAAHVITHADGSPLTDRKQLSVWIARCEAAAGLPVTGHTHVLRHSFVSNLAAAGVRNPRTLMRLAGHESIVTTQRYLHAAEDSDIAAGRVLDRLGGGVFGEPRETASGNYPER